MTKKNNQDIKEITIYEYESVAKVFMTFEQENDAGTIFESFSWINNWYQYYWQQQWQLNCVTYYYKDTLIAIAPFYVNTNNTFPYLKSLNLIGQGEPEVTEVSSEYLDVQIKLGYEKTVLHLLAKKITNFSADAITAKATLKHSNITRLFSLLQGQADKRNFCRYIIDRDSWSLQSCSKNTRARYKRSVNQLKKINAAFTWVEKNDFEKFSQLLAEFHQSRWKNKGKDGAFAGKDFNDFHQNFRNKHPENVRISAIIVDHKPIAINYYLADKNTLYFYQCGWDESKYANLSPGFALHIWSIEHCQLKYYDFMMGGKNDSYKEKFGCQKIPMVNNHVIINKWKYSLNRLINKLLNCFSK